MKKEKKIKKVKKVKKSEQFLVKHIRLEGTPFATVVATSRENIGIAVCCPKDAFNKRRGVEIARGRALKGVGLGTHFSERMRVKRDYLDVADIVNSAVVEMESRAIRYFKAS